MSDEAMETPDSEMMESDLRHYEDVSSQACHWSSGVPHAIRFYWENKGAIAELEAKVTHLAKENAMHIERRGMVKESVKQVMDENSILHERIAKYKDLFDPHNLLGI